MALPREISQRRLGSGFLGMRCIGLILILVANLGMGERPPADEGGQLQIGDV